MPFRWPVSDSIPPAEVLRRVIEAEPLPRNVGTFLAQCAGRSGERPAWRFFADGSGSPWAAMTYRQVDEAVTRLAAGMRARGIRAQSRVAMLLPNTPVWPLSWLAAARIGAIAIPMNIRYVAREIEYVLRDSGADWLIRDASSDALFANVVTDIEPWRVIRHGPPDDSTTSWDDLMRGSSAQAESAIDPAPDDILTIQYTSGTTGFPKGVLLSHRYWLTFMQAGTMETRYLGIERMLLAHPFYYMAGCGWLLFGLRLGATMAVAPGLSIASYVSWLQETRAQYALITSAILNHQLTQPPLALDLRFLHVGAAFPRAKHEDMERAMGCPIRNSYGMTEVGISAYVPIRAEAHVSGDCIGITAPNRDLVIADASGEPVPDGETGEICVKGPGILQGYHNKPDANSASFFGDYHRSGDRAYRDEHGFIHFLGRMKDVIRRNNENVSAVEVETVVLGMPGVQRVAAVAVPDERTTEEIKLYVQLAPGYSQDVLTPAQIYAHCTANLARFKLPRYLAYHSAMPTTMSDKVDKRQLLQESVDPRAGSYDFAEARWR